MTQKTIDLPVNPSAETILEELKQTMQRAGVTYEPDMKGPPGRERIKT